MEFRQLVYFLEVARHGSFTRAGERLHVSQPNLSKTIRSLEEELGATLFNRSTRKAQLTEAGELLRLHAQTVTNAVEGLQAAFADLTELRSGSIKLGLPPVIGATLFPSLIGRFQEKYPRVALSFVEHGSRVLEQAVRDGDLELAVIMLPVEESLFNVAPIIRGQIALGVHPNHRLANRAEVALKELREEKFILFGNTFKVNNNVRDMCIREGFEPNIVYESSHWDFMFEMVAAGLGITLLPELIYGQAAEGRIRVIRRLEPQIPWNLAIIWRKDRYLSQAARGFIDFAREEFK
ncbi:LysR family transcriptional regulator [Cohnella fermenti]|nr:LysR family transcriptional regulator [Cohnella fermenti]